MCVNVCVYVCMCVCVFHTEAQLMRLAIETGLLLGCTCVLVFVEECGLYVCVCASVRACVRACVRLRLSLFRDIKKTSNKRALGGGSLSGFMSPCTALTRDRKAKIE